MSCLFPIRYFFFFFLFFCFVVPQVLQWTQTLDLIRKHKLHRNMTIMMKKSTIMRQAMNVIPPHQPSTQKNMKKFKRPANETEMNKKQIRPFECNENKTHKHTHAYTHKIHLPFINNLSTTTTAEAAVTAAEAPATIKPHTHRRTAAATENTLESSLTI